MQQKLIDILNDNDWNEIAIQIKNVDSTIKEDFHQEKTFLQFVEDNIDKYEAKFEGFELIKKDNGNRTTIMFKFSFDKEKKLSKEYIESLADDIMLNLTEQEVEEIQNTEESVRRKFMKVITIDTQNVEPMYYPFDNAHTYLREDDDMSVNKQEEVLANAPSVEGDYITVVKVVK